MLLIDFFDKGVEQFPDRDVIRHGSRAWTYRQMSDLVDHIASGLIASGMQPGAKIAIYSPNHAYAFACQYGALRAGCVWVPINFRNASAEAIEAMNTLEVDWLFFHGSLASGLADATATVPTLRGRVCLDASVDFADYLDTWLESHPARVAFPRRTSVDTAAIVTTSGTTGKPKGIVLSNRSFATVVASFEIMLPEPTPPVHLVVAPLSHAAGLYACTLLPRGGTNILLDHTDLLSIMQTLQDSRATTLFLPPTVIYMLLAHPKVGEFDFSALRSLVYGAAPMAVEKLREAVRVFGHKLVQGYAQFEAPMMCSILTAEDHRLALENPTLEHRLASAGREGPLVRLAIMDDAGNILPPQERGEIVVRGDILMDGYFKNPEATAEVSLHGWHHTGDVGYKDEDGYVYIVDRKKDLIISGGFNVYPAEVEQVVMAHPSVKDCAVIGVPDEKWGESVMAIIELKPGASFDEAELIAFCKSRLGSLKAPKQAKVCEVLPRSAVGKVQKRELRAPYWAGKERMI